MVVGQTARSYALILPRMASKFIDDYCSQKKKKKKKRASYNQSHVLCLAVDNSAAV